MADNPLDDLASVVKDATYVTVGLGVIAFQRLQVRRKELEKELGARWRTVEERVGATLDRSR
jgi:hypothetical protein